MKWFDRWFYKQSKKAWNNKDSYEEDNDVLSSSKEKRMNALVGVQAIEKGAPEGEGTIRFELSSAVGGKILTVRRNDPRRDSFEQQTYVIPNGENLGERVAKIINLEQYKG